MKRVRLLLGISVEFNFGWENVFDQVHSALGRKLSRKIASICHLCKNLEGKKSKLITLRAGNYECSFGVPTPQHFANSTHSH